MQDQLGAGELRGPRLIPIAQEDTSSAETETLSARRRERNFITAVTFVIPVMLAAIYLFALATDRYESEAKFLIRSPNNTLGQIASLVESTGLGHAAEDAYVVNAFIQSHDAVLALGAHLNLSEILARPTLDVLWRYPGYFSKPSQEALRRHIQDLVSVNFDSSTGISTLRVQAFRPEDTTAIAKVLLQESEKLINRLSERGQQDAVDLAAREVESKRTSALETQERLTAFRTAHQVIDPNLVSKSGQETITRLALERAQASAAIRELQGTSPQSPQIEQARVKISALSDQIAVERAKLAGGDASLAPLIAEYERLSLERGFAEQAFSSALASLEIARADSRRQRLFLETVSAPSQPERAAYPYRILDFLGIALLCFAVNKVVARLIVDAQAHDGA